ncbi:hypothetical protein HK102_011978 [Quaeritorhiza haematococci]|nr:hypothetical protein HK102_011978 [Quaeritorhiza haematococci]
MDDDDSDFMVLSYSTKPRSQINSQSQSSSNTTLGTQGKKRKRKPATSTQPIASTTARKVTRSSRRKRQNTDDHVAADSGLSSELRTQPPKGTSVDSNVVHDGRSVSPVQQNLPVIGAENQSKSMKVKFADVWETLAPSQSQAGVEDPDVDVHALNSPVQKRGTDVEEVASPYSSPSVFIDAFTSFAERSDTDEVEGALHGETFAFSDSDAPTHTTAKTTDLPHRQLEIDPIALEGTTTTSPAQAFDIGVLNDPGVVPHESAGSSASMPCPICQAPLPNNASLAEVHVNRCLDGTLDQPLANSSLQPPPASLASSFITRSIKADAPTEYDFCDFCGKDMRRYNSVRREQHLNRCLDSCLELDLRKLPLLNSTKTNQKAMEGMSNGVARTKLDTMFSAFKNLSSCPCCSASFINVAIGRDHRTKIKHLKQCANTQGVGITTLLALVRSANELEGTTSLVADAEPPKVLEAEEKISEDRLIETQPPTTDQGPLAERTLRGKKRNHVIVTVDSDDEFKASTVTYMMDAPVDAGPSPRGKKSRSVTAGADEDLSLAMALSASMASESDIARLNKLTSKKKEKKDSGKDKVKELDFSKVNTNRRRRRNNTSGGRCDVRLLTPDEAREHAEPRAIAILYPEIPAELAVKSSLDGKVNAHNGASSDADPSSITLWRVSAVADRLDNCHFTTLMLGTSLPLPKDVDPVLKVLEDSLTCNVDNTTEHVSESEGPIDELEHASEKGTCSVPVTPDEDKAVDRLSECKSLLENLQEEMRTRLMIMEEEYNRRVQDILEGKGKGKASTCSVVNRTPPTWSFDDLLRSFLSKSAELGSARSDRRAGSTMMDAERRRTQTSFNGNVGLSNKVEGVDTSGGRGASSAANMGCDQHHNDVSTPKRRPANANDDNDSTPKCAVFLPSLDNAPESDGGLSKGVEAMDTSGERGACSATNVDDNQHDNDLSTPKRGPANEPTDSNVDDDATPKGAILFRDSDKHTESVHTEKGKSSTTSFRVNPVTIGTDAMDSPTRESQEEHRGTVGSVDRDFDDQPLTQMVLDSPESTSSSPPPHSELVREPISSPQPIQLNVVEESKSPFLSELDYIHPEETVSSSPREVNHEYGVVEMAGDIADLSFLPGQEVVSEPEIEQQSPIDVIIEQPYTLDAGEMDSLVFDDWGDTGFLVYSPPQSQESASVDIDNAYGREQPQQSSKASKGKDRKSQHMANDDASLLMERTSRATSGGSSRDGRTRDRVEIPPQSSIKSASQNKGKGKAKAKVRSDVPASSQQGSSSHYGGDESSVDVLMGSSSSSTSRKKPQSRQQKAEEEKPSRKNAKSSREVVESDPAPLDGLGASASSYLPATQNPTVDDDTPAMDLDDLLTSYIRKNRDLYGRILRYEPLDFEELLLQITEGAGIKCTRKNLSTFLDNMVGFIYKIAPIPCQAAGRITDDIFNFQAINYILPSQSDSRRRW